MQNGLQHAYEKNSFPQAMRGGIRRDEFADDLFPSIDDFVLTQALAQAKLLHQLRQQIGRRLPAVRFLFRYR